MTKLVEQLLRDAGDAYQVYYEAITKMELKED